jgi:MFS transporter, DHA1 family, tetracycline resistance protein
MNPKFIPAYLLTFVNVLGFSLLLPVLPFIVEQYGAPKFVYGLLLSIYSFFQFLGAPYLGRLSDTKGRKSILLISQAGTLLSWIIFGLAYFSPKISVGFLALPLIIIAFSRMLDGITGGNSAVAQAYIADITNKEEKGYIFGYVGGIVGLGMIVGPGLGGFLASGVYGYLGMVICAAGISLLTLLSIFFYLDESLPVEKRKQKSTQPLINYFRLIHRIRTLNPGPIIVDMFVTRALFNVMMAAYISTMALYVIDLFSFDEKELGIFMLVVGFFIIINQTVLSKFCIRRFGEFGTLQLGLLLTTVGLIAITITDVLWAYIILYYFLNLGISLCIPTFNSILAQHAKADEAGEVMGISESIIALFNAIIPVFAATLYGLIGYEIYWLISILPILCVFKLRKYLRESN